MSQSDAGEPREGHASNSNVCKAAFETCLKIRGLGIDTAGSLDALGQVLYAASLKRGISTEEVGCGGDESSRPSEAMAKTEGREGELAKSENDCDMVAPVAPVPSGTQGNVGGSALGTGRETSAKQVSSIATSLSPPALWSLEFAYSELERVLEALETAVSGLIFVVGAATTRDVDPEASALWWVTQVF